MMQKTPETIAERRDDVLARISVAANANGRKAEDVTLVAVSKVQPDARIEAMLATGQIVYGENRVQEAQTRWKERREHYADLQLRLIGPLQTNKAEDAVAFFDVIETLDRPKLVSHLAKAVQKLGKCPELFVQVNTGKEEQKSGVLPEDVDAFLASIRDDFDLSVEGLMCIPPIGEPAGPHFAFLKKLADRNGIDKLSMGMSADYETAIRFGATHVRVGSSLFGERIAK